MFRILIVATIVAMLGCGSSSPTAPTPPPVTVTPPVVSPPPPPPPAPTITNYAGRWSGHYTVEACSGSSGSMGDVLCSDARPGNAGGIFKLGTSLPMSLDLSQNGSTITGTLCLGQITGPVSGSVLSNQSMVLTGSAIYSDASAGLVVTNTVTNWSTSLVGGGLEGSFTFGVKVNIFPGDGVVRVRLLNVRR